MCNVTRFYLSLQSNGITYRSNLRLLSEACSVSTCICGAIEKTSEDNATSGDDDVETRDRHIIQGHTNQGPTAGIEEKPFLRKKIQVTDTDSIMATPTSGNNSAHLLLISFATMYS